LRDAPTPVDLAFQVAYKVAHRLLRLYWSVRHPHKGGTLVAVWNAGKILIVKNTYRKQHTLPGGYPRHGETAADTGARELAEECDVHLAASRFREVYRGEHMFEGRRDDVTIVEIELDQPIAIKIDHREISYARFVAPDELLKMLIVPHLREYLERRSSAGAPPSPSPG
jgi:8-oxo-dGTP diphosphatase